jgi:ribosomal protein L32E
MTYLVNDPASTEFLDMTAVDHGLSAMLGDPDAVDKFVGADIQGAHIELRHAVKKLTGLVSDPTRNEVQKHDAAKRLATQVTERLSKTKATLEKRAQELGSCAIADADFALGPKSEKAGLHSEIRDYLLDQTRRPDGLSKVREALAESPEVAAVLWHSPRFLTGLPAESFETMRMEALKSARPDLYANLSNSIGLTKLAAKYETVIGKVSRSFFNPTLAGQANKRVEV